MPHIHFTFETVSAQSRSAKHGLATRMRKREITPSRKIPRLRARVTINKHFHVTALLSSGRVAEPLANIYNRAQQTTQTPVEQLDRDVFAILREQQCRESNVALVMSCKNSANTAR